MSPPIGAGSQNAQGPCYVILQPPYLFSGSNTSTLAHTCCIRFAQPQDVAAALRNNANSAELGNGTSVRRARDLNASSTEETKLWRGYHVAWCRTGAGLCVLHSGCPHRCSPQLPPPFNAPALYANALHDTTMHFD